MTTALGIFAALFNIIVAGFGVLMLLIQRRPNACEYLALPWLLGTATVSLTLWLGGLFIGGIALQMLVAALCIFVGLLGLRRWRKFSPAERARIDAFERMFIGLFIIELAVIFVLALQHTLGWDGLTVWELKARYAFLNGGALPSTYFSDVARRFSHPEYPLLLPLTETWFYLWLGDCDQFWIKLIFPIWYVAAMSILLLTAFDLSGRRWVGWIIVLVFPLVPCIHSAPGGVQVGYADLPLAAIYLAAVFYLLRFTRSGARDDLILFITIAATLPWMKHEGAILWAAISICGAFWIWKQRNFISALLSFLPGGIVIVGWPIFLRTMHALPSRDFVPVSFQTLHANFSRLDGIAREFFLEVSDKTLWDIFWLLTVIALVCVIARERTARAFMLIWFLLAPLCCYCAGYIFSAWTDYLAHIDTSLPRLLIQLTPIAWSLIALALARKIDNYSANAA